MPGPAQYPLLLWVLAAVAGVIFGIARLKLHAFIALTIASIVVGVGSGMGLGTIAQAFQEGVGAMLGSIAVVVGLGMVLGKLLTESGGAEVIAETLIEALGPSRLHWTMALVGFVVGIPVFFTVGVVLLAPILLSVLRKTGQPLLRLGIPLVAGLSVVHGLMPPHPGPMAAIGVMKADPGKVILYAFLVGLPTAIVAGPLLGPWIARRIPVVHPTTEAEGLVKSQHLRPGFGLSLFTVVLPVLLMLMATVVDLLLPKSHPLRGWADLAGHPVVAMLLATLFGFYSFGWARGFNREQVLRLSESCLGPAGSILLVVGAGGGFNRILIASGAGDAMATLARATHFSPLFLGWSIAAMIRVATGSATVAITTAAGLVTPFAASVPGTNMELLVIATGAGSLVLSHVNDGGFWFVKEYFGLTVTETLQSWTVMETVIGVVALAVVIVLQWL